MADGLDLPLRHRRTLEALLREHLPDVGVWAYGSRVNGRCHAGSDLDLVIRGPGLEKIPADRLADFADAVRDSTIPFLIEARDWARLPERFRREIEGHHVVLSHPLVRSVDWPILTLRDAGVQLIDCVHKTPAAQESGYPYIGIPQMKSGRLDFESARKISHEDFVDWTKKAKAQPHDVILSRRTNPGVTAIDRTGTEFALGQNLVLLRADGSWVDPAFLKWLVRSPAWWREIGKFLNVGAVFDSLRCADVPNFELPIPPLAVQLRIAEILDSLDDKIELNRRMNETLEAMARALFKSWFVDFDPVRAKMEGRDPSLPQDVAELFPDRLVESEVDRIPEGWELKALGECFALTMGQSPPGSSYNDQGKGLPFFQGRTDFGFRYPENRKFCTAPSRIARTGDTLVSVRAPVGDINMAWTQCCIGRGVAALRHNSDSSSFTYYSAWTIQANISAYEHTGTVFGAINRKQFEVLQTLEPRSALIEAFEVHVSPMDLRIRVNTLEIRSLTKLRDALLPRLISGDLRARRRAEISREN